MADSVRAEMVDVTQAGPGAGQGKFTMAITIGPNRLLADEPEALGGSDLGPRPHELLLAALGACTAMTLRMYADRKAIALVNTSVHLTRRKAGEVEEITREITLHGDLDAATRARLMEIADKCPVHRTLTGEIKINSVLLPA